MKRSNLSNNVAGQEGKLAATKENLVWFCSSLIIFVFVSVNSLRIYIFFWNKNDKNEKSAIK